MHAKQIIGSLWPRRSSPPAATLEDSASPEMRDWVTTSLSGESRRGWRTLVAAGFHRTGLLRLAQKISHSYELERNSRRGWRRWRRVKEPKFGVLCYHGIGDSGIPAYSALAREAFEAQIRWIRNRYRIVSLDEVCQELQNPRGEQQGIAITFDDGYRNTYTEAFPILEKYRVPATIYLTVGAVETGELAWYDQIFLALKTSPHERLDLVLDHPRHFELEAPGARLRAALEIVAWFRTLPNEGRRRCCQSLEVQLGRPKRQPTDGMLNWQQIRTMQRAGIAFGSHTMTHPVVSRLLPTELERELGESKQILEDRLGTSVRDFAYPFGKASDFGAEAETMLSRCRYRSAATTIHGVNTPSTPFYRLRRVAFGDSSNLALFAFQISRLFIEAESEVTQRKVLPEPPEETDPPRAATPVMLERNDA